MDSLRHITGLCVGNCIRNNPLYPKLPTITFINIEDHTQNIVDVFCCLNTTNDQQNKNVKISFHADKNVFICKFNIDSSIYQVLDFKLDLTGLKIAGVRQIKLE